MSAPPFTDQDIGHTSSSARWVVVVVATAADHHTGQKREKPEIGTTLTTRATLPRDRGEYFTVRLQRTPHPASQRLIHPLTERFDSENISRLWRRYDTEWHHKPGERFLTRKEFIDLLEEMHTTKITEIHDEGMRRIKEGEFCLTPPRSSSYFTSSCIYSSPKERGSTG